MVSQCKNYFSKFLDEASRQSPSYSETETLNLGYDVRDQLKIEIVKNVDVQPKFKSIFLNKGNRFTFKILHGSGHFSVSINNTDLADKLYIDGERVITIVPKKEGPIEIRVEDVEIPDSIVSISDLLISDVGRLEIDTPGTLIESGSHMEINVTAFDILGNQFDDDQYKLMNFNIEIEIT